MVYHPGYQTLHRSGCRSRSPGNVCTGLPAYTWLKLCIHFSLTKNICLLFCNQCWFKSLPLPGWTVCSYPWVNGPCLSLLFSFTCLHGLFLQSSLLSEPTPSLPDPVTLIPMQDTLQWAPWLYSFHALHSAGHHSLSFIPLRSLLVYIISICLMYTVPFALLVMSISSIYSSLPVNPYSYPGPFVPPSLISLSLIFDIFSKSPKLLYGCGVQFTANTSLMSEV